MLSGELARQAGLSADTLRHYERKGLLPKPLRTASGYRVYGSDALARVQLVQAALAIGFSLDELAEILAERERGGAPCQRVRALAEQKLASLEQRLHELQKLRTQLRRLLTDWDQRLKRSRGGRARLLESLPETSGRPDQPFVSRDGMLSRRKR
jgi:DNA-binding transcriptional MerR regulator